MVHWLALMHKQAPQRPSDALNLSPCLMVAWSEGMQVAQTLDESFRADEDCTWTEQMRFEDLCASVG